MADTKVENTDLKKAINATDVLNDSTTSKDNVEEIKKHMEDVASESKMEVNDSSEKKSDLINDIDIKEPKKEIALEDSKTTETVVPKSENEFGPCTKEEIMLSLERKETDQTAGKSNSDDTVAKISDLEVINNVSEEEKTLNEISKAVHEGLTSKDGFRSTVKSKNVQKEDENVDDSQQKADEESKTEDIVKETHSEKVNVPVEAEVKQNIEETQHAECGIVGPPTTVSELIHEEELRAESALSTDSKVQDHVAEWVQNSAKGEEIVIEDEEETPVQQAEEEKKNIREKRTRKKKNNDILALPTRKSQRIVSNIIKKSIKW